MARDDAEEITRISIVFYGAAIILSFVLTFFFGMPGAHKYLLPSPLISSIGAGIAVAFLFALLLLPLQYFLTFHTRIMDGFIAEFERIITPLNGRQILLLCFVSGFAEEYFFRGTLQPAFGLLLTSVLFGLLHFPFKKSLIPWTIYATLMGFYLGWLFEKTGWLPVPVIVHAFTNMSGFYLIKRKIHLSGGQ